MDPERIEQLQRRAARLCLQPLPESGVDLEFLQAWLMDLTDLTTGLYFECERLRKEIVLSHNDER